MKQVIQQPPPERTATRLDTRQNFLMNHFGSPQHRRFGSLRSKGLAPMLCLLAVASSTTRAHADNPIIQTLYTADPAPMVHEGTLYLYTTHDEDVTVNDFFTMNDWRVYSTKDVVNWTDHGSPLHYRDFSWAGGSAWAGQVIFRNGKFYFYVPVVRKNGGNAIGVAVSDSPIGPFVDAIGQPLVTSDCGDIDPTPFIDDDGQAYLYWGNPNLCYVKLNEDMTSYQGGVVKVQMTAAALGTRTDTDRPVAYEEGPWFYKRDDLYYLVYPGGPIPEHIAYSTSPSPTGPWTYKSVVMPAEGSSFTNHPGVVDFGGKSLFFYHNGALPGGGGFKRSVSVEEFTYTNTGGFPELHMTTQGASAVASLDPFEQVEAETIAWSSGVETEECSEGGMNLTDLDAGDYVKVKDVEFGAGATMFEVRVAAASNGGTIELHLDAIDGALVGTCTVDATGGAQTWATQNCVVTDTTDKHDLFIKFGGNEFNFNWWRFRGNGETQPQGTTTDTLGSSESSTTANGSPDQSATSTINEVSRSSSTAPTTTAETTLANTSGGSASLPSSNVSSAVPSTVPSNPAPPASATVDPASSATTAQATGPTASSNTGAGGCSVSGSAHDRLPLLVALGALTALRRRRRG